MTSRFAAIALVAAIATPTADAQDVFIPASGIYRLDAGSSLAEGCQPPCLCPVLLNDNMRGTMRLTPVAVSQFTTQFEVTDVNWVVGTAGGTEQRITGSGTYTRTVNPLAFGPLSSNQSMTLELSFDGGQAATYESGIVPILAPFPSIEISISPPDQFCLFREIHVVTSPVPFQEIQRYRVNRSSFQEGCYPPCLCPLFAERRVQGTFNLIPLSIEGTVEEYAIVDVNWTIAGAFGQPSSTVDGFGTLTRISGFAGWFDNLQLDLSIDGGPLEHYDSGGVNEVVPFPKINLTVSQNGMVCFDRVFMIRAAPIPSLLPLPMLLTK